jgi:tetratricopeptide (TPR) repeat protein
MRRAFLAVLCLGLAVSAAGLHPARAYGQGSGAQALAFVNRMSPLLDEAQQLQEAGQHEAVIAKCSEIIRRSASEAPSPALGLPYQGMARIRLAMSLNAMRRYPDALAELDEAARIFADPVAKNDDLRKTALGWRGKTLLDAGRLEEGLALLEGLRKEGFSQADYQIQRARTEIAKRDEGQRRRREVGEQALARGAEFEQAGNWQEALQVYQAALAALLPDFHVDLAARAIRAARRLNPPPSIPEEARKHAVFGQTAMKGAKQAGDFAVAAQEYAKALALAPWWADVYVNASLALEQTGNLPAAREALKLYLQASPNAPDAQAIQSKMYEIEFRLQQKK